MTNLRLEISDDEEKKVSKRSSGDFNIWALFDHDTPDPSDNTVTFSSNSIYSPKFGTGNFNKYPKIIYFYYMKLDNQGRIVILHYKKKFQNRISHSNVEEKVKEMIKTARDGSATEETLMSKRNFYNVKWRRNSYVVFLMDAPGWKLFKKSDLKYDAVTFRTGGSLSDNVSFFDAKDLEYDFSAAEDGSDEVTAVCLHNYYKKNAAGEDVMTAADTLKYKFDINFRVRFALQGGSEKYLTVIFDPAGDNEGPPGDNN